MEFEYLKLGDRFYQFVCKAVVVGINSSQVDEAHLRMFLCDTIGTIHVLILWLSTVQEGRTITDG